MIRCARWASIFTTLNAKYWVDEFYDWLIVRPFKWLAQFLAYMIDWRFWHDWFHDSVIAATFKRWRDSWRTRSTWASLTAR